jgi:hypothetical protein
MHEWPVRRAAPQHSGWLLKGGSGPFMSIDAKGGLRTFAAVCSEVCNADEGCIRCGCANGSFQSHRLNDNMSGLSVVRVFGTNGGLN